MRCCRLYIHTSNSPATPDTTKAFPNMLGGLPTVLVNVTDVPAPEQPAIVEGKWIWPGPDGNKRKPVKFLFPMDLYIVEGYTAPECPSSIEKLGGP
jgi:hypothetical protein